uniref:Large ribosomal subunit protein uL23c n=1 Tax=Polysiphonia sertularioides TaxID=945028 RepID=A0A1Z1MGR8_9FLOR|nr:ribosomal protein L23 [Polysiphonia sertularioides]
MNKINPDIIRYPIITDKTTKDLEKNKYCFSVIKNASKKEIKKSIEAIFNVKVKKINTLRMPPKTKTIGKFKGKVANNKRAIVQLHEEYSINLFDNEEQ